MKTTQTYKLPTLSALTSLCVALKGRIQVDYRSSDDPLDDVPSLLVTVGANEKGEWAYQTGDNSYMGAAYRFPHWAVVTLTRTSNSRETAREIQCQLAELIAQY